MAWIHRHLLFLHQLLLLSAVMTASGLAKNNNDNANPRNACHRRAFLVTGANKGQGYALCERILQEHDDTYVFLGSRDWQRGQQAAERLGPKLQNRVDVVALDVTNEASIQAAVEQVQEVLNKDNNTNIKLEGIVSNAGILWGYSLEELLDVCTVGAAKVVDAFLRLDLPGDKLGTRSSHEFVLGASRHSHERQQVGR